ncbi:hypothetical protein [Botrimarina sp.]|uniref:hypothetical protein n=1 Tax=Botrimarina sp. TaxID=2795802 RepID=UPI0032EFA781
MVVEKQVLPFFEWLWQGQGDSFIDGALFQFLVLAAVLFVLGLVGGFLVSMIRHGPVAAGEITYRTLRGGATDLTRLSARRIGALAGLAIKESLRRRVLVALVVFALVLLFASWYLRTDNPEPARLYLSFVMTATTYLLLLMALLLAAFSLPGDIKSRTIYTVATKPVRSGDIVLGRMLGFSAIGAVLLAIMAVASWFFVTGSLAHTHSVDATTLEPITGIDGQPIGSGGATSFDAFHRHTFTVGVDGKGVTDAALGHIHTVDADDDRYTVGPAEGFIRARVPKYGSLGFINRDNARTGRGISVGAEWGYRSYIPGATPAAAIWTFDGVNRSVLREGADGGLYLPIGLIVRVYRSYIGQIEEGIQGSIQLRNPETDVATSLKIFTAQDATVDTFDFANEQTDTQQDEITILDDLISSDGRIEVVVQCLDRAQYFGFAQADCFLRLPEGSPLWNFVKGYLAIGMQMVIVVAVAVTASTFLNGPIAMVATVSFILLGFFRETFVKIATGQNYGGGPVESLVRLVTQMNVMSPFKSQDPNSFDAIDLMKAADEALKAGMQAFSYVLPDFSTYLGRVRYVAEGYSIPTDALVRDLVVCAVYVLGAAVIGYFFLRTRELAK